MFKVRVKQTLLVCELNHSLSFLTYGCEGDKIHGNHLPVNNTIIKLISYLEYIIEMADHLSKD